MLQGTLQDHLVHLLFFQKLLDHFCVIFRDVRHALTALPNETLQCQVVGSSERIVTILLHFEFGLFDGPCDFVVLVQDLLQNLHVARDRLLPAQNARVVLDCFYLAEPDVLFDILQRVALVRVRVQDLLYQVSAVGTHEVRDCVFCIQYFFIEQVGLWIFEWKVPANHRVQDHTTRPNISWESIVPFTSHHFRSRIAGASTRCL